MKYLYFSLCLILCSCSMFNKPELCLERPPLNLNSDEPLELVDFEIFILSSDTSKEFFDKNDIAIAMTEQQYKNLSINVEKLKFYLKKQIKIIKLYKDYYEPKTQIKK